MWESSNEQDITAETIHLLRKDLNKTKVHIVHSSSAVTFYFHCSGLEM